MFHLIAYGENGIPTRKTLPELGNTSLISKLENNQAVETWQTGIVNGSAAITLKTVSAISQLCLIHGDFQLVEVTYLCSRSGNTLHELIPLRAINEWVRFMLEAVHNPGKDDKEVVNLLKALSGDYLTVTYRLVSMCRVCVEPEADAVLSGKPLLKVPPEWLRDPR